MELSFTDDFLQILGFSRDEALRTGWHNIGVDHIMLAILRHSGNEACHVLESSGVDPTAFKCHIDEAVFAEDAVSWEERDMIHFCDSALGMLQHAAIEASRCGASSTGPLHFLLAVCRMSGSYSHDYLDECGVSLRALVEASGLPWSRYGLETGTPINEAAAPDPRIMAAAIEKRLLQGYTIANPLVS